MSDNDPYFASRFMHQGTSGAEFIYNEHLAREIIHLATQADQSYKINRSKMGVPKGDSHF